MAEENVDLSEFDDIPDRVARAKAKAEAMRKARGGDGGAPPPAAAASEEPADVDSEDEEAEEVAEEAPEGATPEAEEGDEPSAGGEPEVDLSKLDEITDRVARAKAKAEAMRAAKGGGAAPAKKVAASGAAPAKKAAAKKAPAKKAAATAAGRVAAARELTEKIIVQTSPAPPAIRPGPERTQPVAEGGITTRRGFFSWLTLAWVAFASASAAGLTAMGRFMFPNVLFEPPQSFKIGFPEEFDLDLVDTRYTEKFGVWVVRNADGMYALLSVCTHLGCTPNWLAGEAKFKCPCHGSGFYMSGVNFEGPAPRPLERVRIVLADDGQVLVDKTQKFQYEKGQWDHPDSFLRI